MTVNREPGDAEVIAALRSEVSGWNPASVPHLADLTRPPEPAWQRPVALASSVGAAALAIVLLISVVVVLTVPAHMGWAGTVRDHLVQIP